MGPKWQSPHLSALQRLWTVLWRLCFFSGDFRSLKLRIRSFAGGRQQMPSFQFHCKPRSQFLFFLFLCLLHSCACVRVRVRVRVPFFF
uniref:Uncharacterized protein n=1 Tax=Rhizophora mucronata TaxID=61149 RepID=A0A2P2IL30_RHIMU